VAGSTPQSQRAIANIKRICECTCVAVSSSRSSTSTSNPSSRRGADRRGPTLIKKLPLPLRRLVGDLSNLEHVLVGLDVRSSTGSGES